MFETIRNIVTSPITLTVSALGSAWNNVGNTLSGLLSGGVQGGVFATAAALLGKVFEPTLRANLKPEWWNTIAPYLDARGGMGDLVVRSFRTGAIVGGGLGALSEAGNGLMAGIRPVNADPAQGGLRAVEQAQNAGTLVGGAVGLAGAALVTGLALEHVTGKSVSELVSSGMKQAGLKPAEVVAPDKPVAPVPAAEPKAIGR